MSGQSYSRRETMRMLAAVPAFSAATRPLQDRVPAPRTRSVRLGGPLPGPGRGAPAPNPVELARAARQLGYRAMLCPQVDLKDTARIRAIEAACKAEDVVVAEVGAFGFNMMAHDAGERKAALDMMCEPTKSGRCARSTSRGFAARTRRTARIRKTSTRWASTSRWRTSGTSSIRSNRNAPSSPLKRCRGSCPTAPTAISR